MTLPSRPTVLLGWATVHLLVVAWTAVVVVPWSSDNAIGDWVFRYGACTGAADSHRYFSPGIPDQVIVELTIIDADEQKTVQVLGTGGSQTEFRIFSMTHLFIKHKLFDLFGQSLAAVALGHHPEAQSVVVSLRYYRMPTMAAVRQGATPYQEEFYRGEFVRGGEAEEPVKQ